MNTQPSNTVALADPRAAYLRNRIAIDDAVQGVLQSGWYIMGENVRCFEEEFARYLGRRHTIGTGSGTEALHLALRCCEIGLGDRVATVSHTAVATVAAIELTGARPVLVDVDPDTHTMCPESLRSAFDSAEGTIRAVIPVHLYGHPADMTSIKRIANDNHAVVIEDCAQAHGAIRQHRMAGSWGDLAAFSFYPTKNLGALGDAGAVVTDDDALAEKARLLQQYGWKKRYVSECRGMNTLLDEIQAAVLRAKLPLLDGDNFRRREIAALYRQRLSSISGLCLPSESACQKHVYHQFTIRVRADLRDALLGYLTENGVLAGILYPIPVHKQPAYCGKIEVSSSGLQTTERMAGEILCLPVHPDVSDDQAMKVVHVIQRFFSKNSTFSVG